MLIILSAEDSDTFALLVKLFFRKEDGFEVDTADSVADVFTKLRDKRYDVIILDLGLKDSQGLETLHRIVERTSTPVIVLTGSHNEELKQECMNSGAAGFITKKPFHDQELVELVLRCGLSNRPRHVEEHKRRIQARLQAEATPRHIRLAGYSSAAAILLCLIIDGASQMYYQHSYKIPEWVLSLAVPGALLGTGHYVDKKILGSKPDLR